MLTKAPTAQSALEHGQEAFPQGAVGGGGRGGLEAGGEGGELEGDVRMADLGRSLPRVPLGEDVEQLQIAIAVGVRLHIGERGLAQQVDRVGGPTFDELAKTWQGIGGGWRRQ